MAHFPVKGTFWPDTKEADKEKDFDMIVIGIVKDWRAHPVTSSSLLRSRSFFLSFKEF